MEPIQVPGSWWAELATIAVVSILIAILGFALILILGG